MPSTQDVKFSCSQCAREYRWKPELAGKQAKCKCGAAIAVPAAPPAPPAPKHEEESDLDGLYSLAAEEEKATRLAASEAGASGYRCPACGAGMAVGATTCPSCGADARTGKRPSARSSASGVMAAARGFAPAGAGAGVGVLPYGGGTVAAAAARRDSDNIYEGGKAISLYLPLGIIGIGIIFYVLSFVFSSNKVGAGLILFLVGVRVLLNSLLMLAVLVGTAKFLDTGYGAFGPAVLKIIAIAVGPGAIGAVVSAVLPTGVGWWVGMLVSIVLYFLLIQVLFRLDLGETLLLAGLVCAAQYVATVVIGFVIAALIASGGETGSRIGSSAAAVAIGAMAADESQLNKGEKVHVPTPEEMAADLDAGAQFTLNFVKGGTEPVYFLEFAEDRVLAGMDNKQSIEFVKGLTAMGPKSVVISSIVDAPDKHTGTELIIELPDEPAARKKIFAWRANVMQKFKMTERLLADKKPYRDVGQKMMVLDLPSAYGNSGLPGGAGEDDEMDEDEDGKPAPAAKSPAPAAAAPAPAADAPPAPATPGTGDSAPAPDGAAPF